MKILDYTGTSHLVSKTKTELANKVDKVAGKGLSTNDYTDADKAEVAKIVTKADKTELTKTDRRLDALYELTQGQAWDFETVENDTNPVIVPNGARMCNLQKISGKSVVWNQLFKTLNSTNWRVEGGVIVSEWGDNSATFTTSTVNNGITSTSNPTLSVGHKYLVRALVKANGACRVTFGYQSNSNVYTQVNFTSATTSYAEYSEIKTCASSARTDAYAYSNTTGVEVSVKNLMLFDLTQLFGSGNEPTLVDDPRIKWIKEYAELHPEHNAGEIISFACSEIETVGKNKFTTSNATESKYLNADGTEISNAAWAFTDYINVKPNTIYTVSGYSSLGSSPSVCFYDGGKNYISGILDRHASFTVPSNAIYMRWSYLKADANATQIEEGSTATPYSPYHAETIELPIATYFPDGIKSVVNARDEMAKENATQRIMKVDLGTLDWSKFDASSDVQGTHSIYGSTSLNKLNAASAGGVVTMLSNKYIGAGNVTSNASAWQRGNMTICSLISGDRRVYVRDDSLIDKTPTEFKTAMSGVYLYFELAEPIETTVTDWIEPFEVEAGGTITFVDGEENSIPTNTTEEYTVKLSEVVSNG